MTLNIIVFSASTLSIITIINSISKTVINVHDNLVIAWRYAECHYAECRGAFI